MALGRGQVKVLFPVQAEENDLQAWSLCGRRMNIHETTSKQRHVRINRLQIPNIPQTLPLVSGDQTAFFRVTENAGFNRVLDRARLGWFNEEIVKFWKN